MYAPCPQEAVDLVAHHAKAIREKQSAEAEADRKAVWAFVEHLDGEMRGSLHEQICRAVGENMVLNKRFVKCRGYTSRYYEAIEAEWWHRWRRTDAFLLREAVATRHRENSLRKTIGRRYEIPGSVLRHLTQTGDDRYTVSLVPCPNDGRLLIITW